MGAEHDVIYSHRGQSTDEAGNCLTYDYDIKFWFEITSVVENETVDSMEQLNIPWVWVGMGQGIDSCKLNKKRNY